MRTLRYGMLLVCFSLPFPSAQLWAGNEKAPAKSSSNSKMQANSVKVYKSRNGLKLTIVRLAPTSSKKVLLKVTGSDTDFDNQVVMHNIEESSGKADYVMQLKGQRYVTVAMRQGAYEVYVPSKPGDGITVAYDDKLSGTEDGANIIREFESQTKK